MTPSVRRLCRLKKRKWKKAKKTKKTEDWKNYKTTEKNVKREIEKAHREYTDKFLNLNASENPKKFYSYIKSKRSNTSRIPTLKENDNLLSTPKQKAAALNRQYQSVFTEEPPGDIPTKEDGLITPMANILFTKEGVEKLLKNLDPTKASGPDNISTRILKETATEVAPC